MRHYVYHAPVEPPPRAVASGWQNVVRGLGITTSAGPAPRMCPSWGCGSPPHFEEPVYWFPVRNSPTSVMLPRSGATSIVPQPPPSSGGTLTTPYDGLLPLSPAPSPTIAVAPAQTAPSLTTPGTGTWLANSAYQVGQTIVDANGHVQQVSAAGTSGVSVPNWNDSGGVTVDGGVTWTDMGAGGTGATGITAWLSGSTLISGIPNWGIAAVAAAALFMMMKGRR